MMSNTLKLKFIVEELQTEGQTDRRTDRQRDRQTERRVDDPSFQNKIFYQ